MFSNAFNWWDMDANPAIAPLHSMNKARLEFIDSILPLNGIGGKKMLDYGCGGGLLCEPLARLGANIAGYDKESSCVEAAKNHAQTQQLNINYTADFADISPTKYDAIFCFEMLEHTTNYADEIAKISSMLNDGGLAFFSTINKTFKSLIFAKFAAEYVLKLVPKGMHNFKMFITPQQLQTACGICSLTPLKSSGMFYNPITKITSQIASQDINYICCFAKD